MASTRLTALALGLRFLGTQETVWLTRKQDGWLRDLIAHDLRERHWPKNRMHFMDNADGDGWELSSCAPNGCAILLRIHKPTKLEMRRKEFDRLAQEILRPMFEAQEAGKIEAMTEFQNQYRALCREYGDVTGS